MPSTRIGTMEPELTTEPTPPVAEEEVSAVAADVEEPSDDERLWEPDGPTYAMVKEWKDKYGANNVYVTSVGSDQHIVWRTINRPEYRRLVQLMEKKVESGQVSQAVANMDNEESVAQLCTLFPPYKPEDLAGVASIISQQVMESSGFVALDVRAL